MQLLRLAHIFKIKIKKVKFENDNSRIEVKMLCGMGPLITFQAIILTAC
jgi:hypothetical protein